jgi:hypothetical protein
VPAKVTLLHLAKNYKRDEEMGAPIWRTHFSCIEALYKGLNRSLFIELRLISSIISLNSTTLMPLPVLE